ncbi:hypothetical protein [Niallia taxi]|uniref:hypothetical protein n=1 Tax=Niallia taxi TaxID=2499688 RepID=UPI003009336D
MSGIIKPELEIKIKTEFVDLVKVNEDEESTLYISQYEDDPEYTYIILDAMHVKVKTKNLMDSVSVFNNRSNVSKINNLNEKN